MWEKIMYEMYPDTWADQQARREQRDEDRPRRRARKQHSVVPPVIAHQLLVAGRTESAA